MQDNTRPMNPAVPGTSHSPSNQSPGATDDAAARSVPRPLLTELAERVADLLKSLRRNSTMRESLEEVIEESEREAQELSSQERLMLTNLLNFGGLSVSDVMVPRADIIAVEEQTSLSELIALFREAQHSRLPIYRETLDDPLGMIHVKDILALAETGPDGQLSWPQVPITKLRRELLFVPAAMPALDLLMRMQASRIHLALVIDEYGGTDGLVSIEDLVEQIVGEIGDEHDTEESPDIVTRTDGKYDADARVTLEDFKERTAIDLTKMEQEEDVDTLGGLVAVSLGRVPVRGEIVSFAGLEFEILEADPRHAKRLRIRPLTSAPLTAAD
jgi:CBS domain containing-hemolysin-like protein